LSLIANSEKATVIRSALLAKADRLQVDTVKPDVKGAGDVLEGQTALTAAMRGRGRIKTEIVWSDDWNRRETLFDNFDTRWMASVSRAFGLWDVCAYRCDIKR